jgi:hypothetical protein
MVLGYLFAVLALIATGCTTGVQPPRSAVVGVPYGAEHVALATFSRFAVGSHGRITGYIRGWSIAGPFPRPESRDLLFTYVADFQIVQIPWISPSPSIRQIVDLPIEATGTRRIYFHPDGVRIAFSDPSRFIRGEPIATEQVRFTFRFMPDFAGVSLRVMTHRTSVRAFDYAGQTISPVMQRDDSFVMFGRPSSQYGGFLLTGGEA